MSYPRPTPPHTHIHTHTQTHTQHRWSDMELFLGGVGQSVEQAESCLMIEDRQTDR